MSITWVDPEAVVVTTHTYIRYFKILKNVVAYASSFQIRWHCIRFLKIFFILSFSIFAMMKQKIVLLNIYFSIKLWFLRVEVCATTKELSNIHVLTERSVSVQCDNLVHNRPLWHNWHFQLWPCTLPTKIKRVHCWSLANP